MNIKLNIVELCSKLAHNDLKRIYGETTEIMEDVIEEYVGTRYKKEVQQDFDEFYDYYYDIMINNIVYPFKEGDDYYIIEEGKVVKSCWDDISEELYRANPDRRLFAKESVALMYLVQQSNEKRIKQMRKNNEEG